MQKTEIEISIHNLVKINGQLTKKMFSNPNFEKKYYVFGKHGKYIKPMKNKEINKDNL